MSRGAAKGLLCVRPFVGFVSLGRGRVRKPRDKPVVEGSVRFVANQVAAVLRNRRFVGLADLNEAIFDDGLPRVFRTGIY